MYYQPTSAGIWPGTYPYNIQQPQQAISAAYYQVPSLPTTTTIPEVVFQQPQSVPTVYYQLPPITAPPIQTTATTTSEAVATQPQTTTTTTKSVTTRVLDSSTVPTIGNNAVVEETKTTTTVNKPEVSTVVTTTATDVPPVTTTTIVPTIETTKIQKRPAYRPRRFRTLSTSTYSDDTTTSTNSTVTPPPTVVQQQTIFPSQLPYQTTGIVPVQRVVHRPVSSPSGYYSSDLDYGKRKVYKTDYKYRHYYCCNYCRGRCDLHNRSYSCCEWFYGCPLWAFIILGLFFLALLGAFFALFGLQPTINSERRSETVQTRLINRTQVIYGFYQNCGYQVNATNVPTTLILCTNTGTTTTARIELSSFYSIISGTNSFSYTELLILLSYFSVLII